MRKNANAPWKNWPICPTPSTARGDAPNRGWATKEEEIKTHLFNAVRLVLILANVSCGQRKSVGSEDVGCIVDEGFTGYEKVWEKLAE